MKRQQISIATSDLYRFLITHSDYLCRHPQRPRLFRARCLDRPTSSKRRQKLSYPTAIMARVTQAEQRFWAGGNKLVTQHRDTPRSSFAHSDSRLRNLQSRAYLKRIARTQRSLDCEAVDTKEALARPALILRNAENYVSNEFANIKSSGRYHHLPIDAFRAAQVLPNLFMQKIVEFIQRRFK